MKPLTKDQESKIHQLFSLKGEVDGFTSDRVDYIIRKISSTFGGEVDWWSYPNSSEYDSMGSFEDAYDKENFSFDGRFKNRKGDWAIITNDGGEYGFDNEFPTRWLYEEFEEELINGKRRLEEKLTAKKEDAAKNLLAKKSKKQKLLESARAKLTEEEKNALDL